MKHLFLFTVLALTSCAGTGEKTKDVAAKCLPSPRELLGEVDTLLESDNYTESLKQLGLSRGVDAVFCALSEVVDYLSRPGAPAGSGPKLSRALEARAALETK